jgi:peptide chain release factor 2
MNLGGLFDIEAKREHLQKLETQTYAPNFWDDRENAQQFMQKATALKEGLKRFANLESIFSDATVLWDLAVESDDDKLAAEAKQQLSLFLHKLETVELDLILSGPYDDHNAILSLHAGAGGVESQDWVEMLLRMYTRYCDDNNYKTEILDYLAGDEAGVKSVTLSVVGPNAYGYLKSERGVHRLVRISPFDAAGRRHTSFASVDVLPQVDNNKEVEIDEDDLRIDTYRSGGKGGQHLNKTDSAVRITHMPTGIVVQCQDERSQFSNKDKAMRLLAAKLLDVKIKDHRTNIETGNVDAVMDGDIGGFITAYLQQLAIQ